MSESIQVWVRNDKGQVYGPLSPPSVELLIDNGIIGGRLQVSTNGEMYVYPGRIPGLRMIFPKSLWGDTVVPGDEQDAQWSQVALPAALPSLGAAPAAAPGGPVGVPGVPGGPVGVPGGPVAGPGARGPVAGPGARVPAAGPGARGPVAGPGARPVAPGGARPVVHRPPSGSISSPSGIQRPPTGPLAAPPVVSSESQMASIEEAFRAATGGAPGHEAPMRAAAPAPSSAVAKPRAPVSAPSGVRAAPPAAAPARARPATGPAAVAGDLEIPPSGELGDLTPPQLYYRAAASEAHGLLTLKLPDRELVVHFRKGNPEFIDSTHPEDSLDTFLIEQRLATADQLAQAESQKARFGDELLPALFGLGLLNPNAVFQQLGQRAGHILFKVLTAEHGEFAFDLEELPPAKAMPLGNKWGLYLEQLRRLPPPEIKRRLHGALELPVMKGEGPVAVTELRLTPQETRALHYFDGVRTLLELISDLPQDADLIMRTAYMLHPLELVSFAGVVQKSRTGSHAAFQPRPAPAAPRPAAAVPGPPAMVAPPAAAVPGPPVMVAQAAAAVPGPPVMVAQAAAAVPGPPVMAPGNPANVHRASVPYPGQKPVAAPVLHPPTGPSPAEQAARAAEAQAPARPVISPPTLNPAPVLSPPTLNPAPASMPSGMRSAPSGIRSAPSGVRASSSQALPAVDPATEIRQLEAQLAQMKDQNYFEILGLKKDADPNVVKVAYLKAARSYHPDTVPPGAPEALAKAKADLFARIGEANRTLSDPKLREEYVAELNAGGTGSKVDIEKILRAEELFNRGTLLVKNRKYPEALQSFDEAIANNPEEGEFFAWRGYTKFLVAPDKKLAGPEALRDLNICIARNANVAAAYYFLGFIAKTNGDAKGARANFKKCVDLDPKHIDAQRELRAMK